MHATEGMIHSPSKSAEAANFIPTHAHRFLNGLLEIVGFLVPNLLHFNPPVFIVGSGFYLQAIKIANNVSNFIIVSKRGFIQSVRPTIGQNHILTTLQTSTQPVLVEEVVDNNHT